MPRSARNLQQTTVVITGASAGVGRAVALRFARAGANFALIARDAAALGAEKLGTTALVVPVGVADADAMFEAADTIAHELGGIDISVNVPWSRCSRRSGRSRRTSFAAPPR